MGRQMCHRGVVYITDVCNARCPWCYYQAFLDEKKHVPFEEVKNEVEVQRFYYDLGWTDITGRGEPTLHPKIKEIVSYCAEVDLKPTVITNGLLPNVVGELIKRGLDDLLLSIQGIGEIHDRAVAVNGAFKKVLETMTILKDSGFRFRTNTTLTKINMENLPSLAKFLLKVRPRLVNFIAFNPHEGTDWSKQSSIEFQARYSEIAPHLAKAIDILMVGGIWVNVRYFPLCILQGYEKHICDFHQHQYDPTEWNLCEGFELKKEQMLYLTQIAKDEGVYGESAEEKLLNYLVRRETQGNLTSSDCKECVNLLICDGLYSQYARRFGFEELRPIVGNVFIRDPLYYRLQDLRWLTEMGFQRGG